MDAFTYESKHMNSTSDSMLMYATHYDLATHEVINDIFTYIKSHTRTVFNLSNVTLDSANSTIHTLKEAHTR